MSGSNSYIFIVVNEHLHGGKRLKNKSPRAETRALPSRGRGYVCGRNFPQKRRSKKKEKGSPLVLKINFKDTKQVLCSVVSFRRKP